MTYALIRKIKKYKDRHGKLRVYHRATGIAIDQKKFPIKSVEFFVEFDRITREHTPLPTEKDTLGHLVEQYQKSADFIDKQPRTQSDYMKLMKYLEPAYTLHMPDISRGVVMKIRDRARETRTDHFANYLMRFMSLLFNWAKDRGLIDTNPAEGIKSIKRAKDAPRANRPWTRAEMQAVIENARWGVKEVLALCMYAGLRKGDALAASKTIYNGHTIEVVTQKTGRRVKMPAPVALKFILDSAPAHPAITIAANADGKPWKDNGFNSAWKKLRAKLEAQGSIEEGLTIHGLRHTVATMLREAGVSKELRADFLGHSSTMADWYSRDADMSEKMRDVVEIFDTTLSDSGE